ncbi:MAG: MTH938/NDUFAF3 family protein [Promethearchaeota archaeon]
MKFEQTKFGSITISGKTYSYDIYLHVNGEISPRDKSQSKSINGHRELSKWELEILLKENPDVLLIGMGQSGILPLSKETKAWLNSIKEEKTIEIITLKTPDILPITNRWLNSKKKIAGVFHVTC